MFAVDVWVNIHLFVFICVAVITTTTMNSFWRLIDQFFLDECLHVLSTTESSFASLPLAKCTLKLFLYYFSRDTFR